MLICNVIVSPSQKRQIDIYRKGWGVGGGWRILFVSRLDLPDLPAEVL